MTDLFIVSLMGIAGALLIPYALLLFYYHRVWDQIPVIAEIKSVGSVKVSVIVPARNESLKIDACLHALLSQNYPADLTEIIVINDFSTDDTAVRVSACGPRCTLINLSDHVTEPVNSYKKKAIETGIGASSGELILCTDADCTMDPGWITTMVHVYSSNDLSFIAAPVKIISDGSWLSVFQVLDFISLQGITGAAASKQLYPMCNGANLAYTRTAYEAVDGFAGIDQIASGDDMLLMKKIQRRFPGKTGYVKSAAAIVQTAPAGNLQSFMNQRIRWASKISHYKDPATFATLGFVYLLNLFLLVIFFACFFFGYWKWLLLLLMIKTLSEYFFVAKVSVFFGQRHLMKFFPLCQPFHILYTVIAGSFGSFGKYEWKNRKVK